MGGEQDFLEQTVIDKLDADLATAGVTNRSYGVIGYGGKPATARTVGPGLTDAAGAKINLGALNTSGGFEDGYQAIDYALNNLNFTSGAAINFILVTDEDRDVTSGTSFTTAGMLAALKSSKILLNAVISNPFTSTSANASEVIELSEDGTAYVADGMGGYITDTGGTVGNGAGTTEADYAELALDTGGAAWNLNLLRAGGDKALSFADAFIDTKVAEIISQPPTGTSPVPLPAGMPLLLAGLGAFGVARARSKKAKA